MPPANLAAMDLNLLVVLDALLIEQSVSKAAKRINSTQSAVSRSLGRLRVWFGDPLLTRTRHGMVPTPTGLALASEVRGVLEQIQGFVLREPFDPSSSRRAFRLTMSDYPQYLLCGPLLAKMRAAAPLAGVRVLPWSLGFVEGLESGTLDCAICPPTTHVPGFHSQQLFTDELVVVVRRDHPTVKSALTAQEFAALTHLQVAPTGRDGSWLDDLLQASGLSRQVVMHVPSILVAPMLVASSDCCATIPRRLAAEIAEGWKLKVLPVPLEMPRIALSLVWHERSQQDAGAIWLRAQIAAILGEAPHRKSANVPRIDLSRRAARTL